MKFKDIYGHETLKQQLIYTVKENRISHAQLFLGPEGSANLALALAYAQYINCENKTNGDACGVCPSCLKYEKLIHPDLHFIFPVAKIKGIKKDKEVSCRNRLYLEKWRESLLRNQYHLTLDDWLTDMEVENQQAMINTEDAKSIIGTLSLQSYEAEYKVVIIWMTELLHHAAAPRILKILEEPPKKTLFLLIAEHSDSIITTILSRSQVVKIPAYEKAPLAAYLREKQEAAPEQAEMMARLAEGNLAHARQLIGDNETETRHFALFRDWMRACFKANFPAIQKFVDELTRLGREHQKHFLRYSLTVIRKSMLLNYGGETLVQLSEMESKFVHDFSPFINHKNLNEIVDELNTAIYHIERNAKAEIIFTDMSIKISKWLHIGKKA
jgi:DNA polymerase-3 subunit delta'